MILYAEEFLGIFLHLSPKNGNLFDGQNNKFFLKCVGRFNLLFYKVTALYKE